MILCVESDLILKRSFPGSFAVARVSGGDPTYPGNCDFFHQKSWKFMIFHYFESTEIADGNPFSALQNY